MSKRRTSSALGYSLNKATTQLDVSGPRRWAEVPDVGEHVGLRAEAPQVIAPAHPERRGKTGGRRDEADEHVPRGTVLIAQSGVPGCRTTGWHVRQGDSVTINYYRWSRNRLCLRRPR